MTLLRAMPVLQVRDVRASETFYQSFGFLSHGIWDHGGVAQFCILQWAQVTMALQRADEAVQPIRNWVAYLYCDDVSALHARASNAGAKVGEIRRDTPYGCDDFDLTDPDGHVLAFGQDMNPVHGPGLMEQTL